MKFTSYITLALVALALPFGNAFGMTQKGSAAPSAAPQTRYERILEIIRTSAAKRKADMGPVKGKVAPQKGQKAKEEGPRYLDVLVSAKPESTQEFGTAATRGTQAFNTAATQGTQAFGTAATQRTQTMRTAQQTQQFNTALATGTLPRFNTSQEEIQFLTALEAEIRAVEQGGNLSPEQEQRAQGWLSYIGEQIGWLMANGY